ncbi:MAG: hypothetical protein GX200_06250 [Firmicutes bacterium]|nr:hypothetical protein [Bacillota bacterium]
MAAGKGGKKSKKYRQIIVVLSVLLCLYFFLVLYAGYLWGSRFYFGMLLVIFFLPVLWLLVEKMKHAGLVEELQAAWGKKTDRVRDLAELKKYARLFPVDPQAESILTEQSQDDLHFDFIFTLLDRTLTTPGAQVLYNMLQRPLLAPEKLKARSRTISLFDSNPTLRLQLLLVLKRLSRQHPDTITGLLWDDAGEIKKLGIIPGLLALLALAALVSVFFFGLKGAFLGLLPMFIINFSYAEKQKREYFLHLPALRYASSLLAAAQELSKACRELLPVYSETLAANFRACGRLLSRPGRRLLRVLDSFGLYDYINVLFLLDVRSYAADMAVVMRTRKNLQQLYQSIGEIDALLAVSSFRAGSKNWCEPRLWPGASSISAEEIYHPLLANPVANSIVLLQPGTIVTGSNMAGKSTFLRTVAVNAVLAQTIYTCFAQSYEAGYFSIVTSINKDDYLPGGKSYFLVEAEAILAMIRKAESSHVVSLCIIDELFRGTNSAERIPAAIEVLKYFADKNILCVIATHDLEVAESCSQLYALYHFSERVGAQGLEFDYKLHKGIATSRNAIRVLEYLGYPETIVKQAWEKAERRQRQKR